MIGRAHLSFLQHSSERDDASFLGPPRPTTGMASQVDVSEPDGDEDEGKDQVQELALVRQSAMGR